MELLGLKYIVQSILINVKCHQKCIYVADIGWFKRHAATTAHPTVVVTEGSAGTLNFKNQGIKTNEKTISLGEEHSETLPNGEMARVSSKKPPVIYDTKKDFIYRA